MKLTFLVILTILSLVLDAQVKTWYDYGGLPAPKQPNINSIDTNIIVNESIPIESLSTKEYHLSYKLLDYEIIHYKNDSSLLKFYYTKNGILKNNKKYGKWLTLKGYCEDGERIYSNKYFEYFLNDYEIYFDKHITQSIKIDIINDNAFCDFIYYNEQSDTINLSIEYWVTKDKSILTKCIASNGNVIFEDNVKYIEEHFKRLFDGLYNSKIYER